MSLVTHSHNTILYIFTCIMQLAIILSLDTLQRRSHHALLLLSAIFDN
jgi:hypothetical protein